MMKIQLRNLTALVRNCKLKECTLNSMRVMNIVARGLCLVVGRKEHFVYLDKNTAAKETTK